MAPHAPARILGVRPRVLIKGLILILSFALVGYLLKSLGFGASLNEQWIDSEIRGKGVSGEVLFVAVAAVATAIGVPRQFLCFLGGYAFGFAIGTALGLLASGLGCVITFFYARFFGKGLVQRLFAKRIKRLDEFLSDNPFSMTLLIRLLPVGSNLATNLVGGVTSAPALPFVLGSVLGYIPQTVIFVLLGSGIHLDPVLRIGTSAVLFIASGLLGVVLYRRFRRGKTLDEGIDAEIGNEEESESQR